MSTVKKFNIGEYVRCPFGFARVWEVYPDINRCGVILEDHDQPLFFSIDEIKMLRKMDVAGLKSSAKIDSNEKKDDQIERTPLKVV